MQSDDREEIGALLAGLIGVLAGLALRRARTGDREEPLMAIGTSTLIATPALARIAGDALKADRANTRVHAALSFAVGAVLALFADQLARYLPSGTTEPSD